MERSRDVNSAVITQLYRLLNDGSKNIREQALNVLRNLACGQERDIEAVVAGLGAPNLSRLIEIFLETEPQNEEIVTQVCLNYLANEKVSLHHSEYSYRIVQPQKTDCFLGQNFKGYTPQPGMQFNRCIHARDTSNRKSG